MEATLNLDTTGPLPVLRLTTAQGLQLSVPIQPGSLTAKHVRARCSAAG